MATTYPGAGDPDGDRRRLALMLARGALDASPVRHWTQGAARLAQALIGGQLMAEDGDRRETASRRTAEALAALASEASGQRGYFRDVRAPDTRPEPSSSARARLLGGGASTSTSEFGRSGRGGRHRRRSARRSVGEADRGRRAAARARAAAEVRGAKARRRRA